MECLQNPLDRIAVLGGVALIIFAMGSALK